MYENMHSLSRCREERMPEHKQPTRGFLIQWKCLPSINKSQWFSSSGSACCHSLDFSVHVKRHVASTSQPPLLFRNSHLLGHGNCMMPWSTIGVGVDASVGGSVVGGKYRPLRPPRARSDSDGVSVGTSRVTKGLGKGDAPGGGAYTPAPSSRDPAATETRPDCSCPCAPSDLFVRSGDHDLGSHGVKTPFPTLEDGVLASFASCQVVSWAITPSEGLPEAPWLQTDKKKRRAWTSIFGALWKVQLFSCRFFWFR